MDICRLTNVMGLLGLQNVNKNQQQFHSQLRVTHIYRVNKCKLLYINKCRILIDWSWISISQKHELCCVYITYITLSPY